MWVGRWAWILIRRVSCGCGEVVDWGAFLLLLSSLFVFVVQFAVGGLIESSRLVSLFLSPTFGRIWRYELTGDPDRRCCEATLALEKPRAFFSGGTSEVTERETIRQKLVGECLLAACRTLLCWSGRLLVVELRRCVLSGYLTGDEQLRKFSGTVLPQLVGGVGIVLGG